MKFKTKTERMHYEFYLKIKQYLNNGIPNVHLSKGCIGELALFEEENGKGMALIYLWQPEFNDFLGLRNEFKRHGASKIHIYETMDDESVSICNGVDLDGLGRSITVEFAIEQRCEELEVARSKAYRAFWDMAYRVARTELSHGKSGHEFNVLYLVKYMLKATHISVNENAVDLGDAIKMVEQAIDSTQPDAKPPTQSELRRFELEQKAERLAEYEQTLFKSRHTATPRQIWTLYYRAKRLDRQTGGKATCLFYCFHHVGNDVNTKDMRKCCVDIFYPGWKRSKSAERRIKLMLKANGPFTLNFCTVADLAQTPFDDELPF